MNAERIAHLWPKWMYLTSSLRVEKAMCGRLTPSKNYAMVAKGFWKAPVWRMGDGPPTYCPACLAVTYEARAVRKHRQLRKRAILAFKRARAAERRASGEYDGRQGSAADDEDALEV